MLIEKLCNLGGVSGNEADVRNFIKKETEAYADSIITDSMGNLFAFKKGSDGSKRIMLSAHMDEVGFIISGITEKGFLEFKKVGGTDTRVIIAKKVFVGEKKVPGVIGIKAVHLQKRSERNTVPDVSSMYIDIGANSRAEAEKLVEIGDYAVFATEFERLSEDKIKAKAIDDRAGCAILAELIKKPVKYDTYFCFLVQEEVGLRGARCAAERVKPDIALVLEATTCSDVYGCEEHEYVTTLGGGVVITARDSSSIVFEDFRRTLEELCRKYKIPYQYKRTTRGGNDAGAIHLSGSGVKTASLSVPCRYLHSPAGIASLSDIEAMKALTEKFLEYADLIK